MGKKPIPERENAYDHIPKWIKDSFTIDEKEAFLYEEVCPDSIFEKLKDFVVKD